jgi:hypothetical protein
MSFSQKPHPAIEVLLQTKVKPKFDRAVTARSKPFRARFYQRNSCSSVSFCVMLAAGFEATVCLSISAITNFGNAGNLFLPTYQISHLLNPPDPVRYWFLKTRSHSKRSPQCPTVITHPICQTPSSLTGTTLSANRRT